ncbi:MAG: OmpA family protein [Candidatus Krumholzibacteria bacterium]
MRTCILVLVLVGGLLFVRVLPGTAGDRHYHGWKHTEDHSGEFGRSLAAPWPFRSRTERLQAAAIRPSQTRDAMETELVGTGVLRVTNIHFVTGKARLTAESRQVLDGVGRLLMDWPSLRVEISGHADSRGSEKLNQVLSFRRAKAVRKYLIRRCPIIRGRLLAPVGYGESQPAAPNSTVQGLAKNRRVEFRVLNRDELVRIAQMRAHRARGK